MGILALIFSAIVGDVPAQPPNPCYEGCTPKMERIRDRFNAAGPLSMTPALYSGECFHLSRDYDPEYTHYAAVMVDQNDLNQMKPYFSAIFSYFYPADEAANWDLNRARQEMSPEWKNYGRDILVEEETARVVVYSDGAPVYIYWSRQDPMDGTLFLITYAGGTYMKSFCELKKR